jgi:hypothetical protein
MKLNISLRQKFFLRSLVAGFSILVLPNSWALPDPRADISSVTAKVSLEGIGEVIGDDKERNVLYVKPSHYNFKGKFQQTNGSIDCKDLVNLRKMTYRMPSIEEFPKVLKNTEFFSPAFESSVGISAKNIDLIRKIADTKFQTTNYLQEHKAEFGAYASSKAELDLIISDQKSLEAQSDVTISKFTQLIVLAEDPVEKEHLRQLLREELQQISNKKNVLFDRKLKAQDAYHQALEDWAPYKEQLEWLTKVELNLQNSFDRLQQVADDSLKRSRDLIQTLESEVIGLASVAYSLAPDKQMNLLSTRLKDASISDYNVQAIMPFDVRLNPGVTKSLSKVADSTMNLNYEIISYEFPAHTKIQVGDQQRWVDLPGVTLNQDQKQPEKYRFMATDFGGSFGGAQSFEMPVTQGALCGYGKSSEKHYQYTDGQGQKHSRTISHFEYEFPTKNQPVFVQNVALRYNYYQKAEPISGFCRMDIDKSDIYIRNSGVKKWWSWFSRNTHTWDDTKRDVQNNLGLTCHMIKRPQGANAEDANKINRAMEKGLYQDMFNMFVMTYAKEYTINPTKPEVLDEDSKLFGQIGNSVLTLCGTTNPFCAIGGIVLKSLDELAGARHSGTTSSINTNRGVLEKNFSQDGYLIAEAQAIMEMRVCVDHKKCDE